MASEKPSAWAWSAAKRIVSDVLEDEEVYLPDDILGMKRKDVARALDAAHRRGCEQGRREREAEIVGWLRTDGPGSPADVYGSAVGGNEWTTAADAIKRGAGRKERP